MTDIYLMRSPNPDKKFRVRVGNKNIDFGAEGYTDYILSGGDKQKRNAYLARHSKMGENWTKSGINTRGWWSRWLLWQEPTLQKAINNIENKFNVKIHYI